MRTLFRDRLSLCERTFPDECDVFGCPDGKSDTGGVGGVFGGHVRAGAASMRGLLKAMCPATMIPCGSPAFIGRTHSARQNSADM
ncbi:MULTISPECIES: hypothetical protein [Gordonia]|uniref:hypothetical protein n=1 Tax=Gordonia TaxID=2053 RepID=UPI001FE811AB|nr:MULTISPECIES: hypothetical protein [Gordonia]